PGLELADHAAADDGAACFVCHECCLVRGSMVPGWSGSRKTGLRLECLILPQPVATAKVSPDCAALARPFPEPTTTVAGRVKTGFRFILHPYLGAMQMKTSLFDLEQEFAVVLGGTGVHGGVMA